jgi:2-methylisocitrate lyase-like PEP mutase family enzyme
VDTTRLREHAERLRALHHDDRPLVLPNAWDAASARMVVAEGFPVVATTSAGVAASLGYADHQDAPADEVFPAVGRIARAVDVPVTADLEAGYGLPPAELVHRMLAAGVVGANLEDTDHRAGGLAEVDAHAAWLAEVRAAARAAGVDLVLNARVDVYLHDAAGEHQLSEALRRARAYRAAGADCVYPILVADEPTIQALVDGVDGPLNVLARPGAPSLDRLAELGVARISFGGGLHKLATNTLGRALNSIADHADPYAR